MLDYASISAVGAVVRQGSFEKAAAVLGMTPSAVSQRVRGLEERLGAILVVRGQPCMPTDLGRTLCSHLDRVRLLEHDLAPALAPSAGAADAPLTIRIAVNSDSLATWLPEAFAAFGRDGEASLHITLDDEGHTAERLRLGEVLAAITADPRPVQGCRTTELGTLRYAACASPTYVATYFPDGLTPEALAKAPHLRFEPRDMFQERWAREAHAVELSGPMHWIPSTHGFVDVALAGLGWGMHPIMLVEHHLATGRLVELPPAHQIDVQLHWTVARLQAKPLQRLTDAIRDAARAQLETV
jgi:LysR family transcriptional regulator (chromosome initiation inhibitor)